MEEWKELCTTEVSLTKWSCNDTMHTLAKQHDYRTCIKTTISSQVAVKTNHPPRYQLQWSINAPWHYLVVGASLLLNESCFSHNSSIVQTAPLAPALCHTSCNQIPCSQYTTLPGQSLKYNWPCSRHWFRASLNKKKWMEATNPPRQCRGQMVIHIHCKMVATDIVPDLLPHYYHKLNMEWHWINTPSACK